MKLTNGCAIFGDKNGPQGSGTYFSINKVMASLRAPSYANLLSNYRLLNSKSVFKATYNSFLGATCTMWDEIASH